MPANTPQPVKSGHCGNPEALALENRAQESLRSRQDLDSQLSGLPDVFFGLNRQAEFFAGVQKILRLNFRRQLSLSLDG